MSDNSDGQANSGHLHRSLGVRDIVLINIAAVLGVRWLSTAAQMGPSSLTLWVLAVLVFFIPSALTVTELSSRHPGEGGIYLWSKSAFGEFHGFVSGWAYWVNNVFYFPSLLLVLAGAFLFIGGERWLQLGDSSWYNTVFSLVLIWLVIAVNVIGVERGKWIASVGAFAAIAVFVVLAITGTWAWTAHGSATQFTAASLIPDVGNFTTLTFFATMTFAFSGMELAPAMAGEIREPKRTNIAALAWGTRWAVTRHIFDWRSQRLGNGRCAHTLCHWHRPLPAVGARQDASALWHATRVTAYSGRRGFADHPGGVGRGYDPGGVYHPVGPVDNPLPGPVPLYVCGSTRTSQTRKR